MTDYHGIGAVSATLQALLRDRMAVPTEVPGGTFDVTVGPPPTVDQDGNGSVPASVNLFLYKVTENAQLKNQEIPGHGHPAAYGHPPLSLNLHYLLTAYGTTADQTVMNETVAHYLLGSAMQVLHDFPAITEHLQASDGQPLLHLALRGEFEQMKVVLEPLTLEDLSKVWTALTLPYRVSAAYLVTVVQIESLRPRRFPRLVGEPPDAGPRIIVTPLRAPRIEDVRVRRVGDPPGTEHRFAFARIGDTLILIGRNFASRATRVRLDAVDATAAIAVLRDDRIEIAIPNDSELQSGVRPVQVELGVRELPQTGFRSNAAAFTLVPLVNSITKAFGATPRRLTIAGDRLYADDLTGETLIGCTLVPSSAYLTATPTSIAVPVADSLPAFPTRCFRSGSLSPFPALPDPMDLQVTIGGEGPLSISISPPPADLNATAIALQAAIRGATSADAGFQGARIATADDRFLVVVPGGLRDSVTVGGPGAASLSLNATTAFNGYLSGELEPFLTLSSATPQFDLSIDGSTLTVAVGAPASVGDVATTVGTALSADPRPVFANSLVTTTENQLLILPGDPAAAAVTCAPLVGVDETTVGELQLAADFVVRVRVNGAEAFEETVRLP